MNARPIQFSSVVIKILKKAPICHNSGEKTDPYERHAQYHLTIKYPPPGGVMKIETQDLAKRIAVKTHT